MFWPWQVFKNEVGSHKRGGGRRERVEGRAIAKSEKGGGKKLFPFSCRGLTLDFVKKYVEHARNLRPALTDAANELIAEAYSQMRAQAVEGTESAKNVHLTTPVTARSVETMIRLSTAHAKARLSTRVEADDAEFAIGMIQYAAFKKVMKKRKKRKQAEDNAGSDGESECESEEETQGEGSADEDGAEPPLAKRGRMEEEEEDTGSISEDMLAAFATKLNDLYK